MKTITMLELRQNSESLFSSLKRGVSLVLTYRGEKLAIISPYQSAEANDLENDPLFNICDNTVESPLGNLSENEEDRLIYEF